VNRHPWELARLKTILQLVESHRLQGKVLDIGAGDCFIAEHFANELHMDVTAVDAEFKSTGVANNVQRYSNLQQVGDHYDVLLMLDVMEHVQDDASLIRSSVAHLKDGGTAVITVPAFQFLYSGHDRFLGHYRRYTLQGLTEVAEKAGLEKVECFYFFFSLFFARMFSKLASVMKRKSDHSELTTWSQSQNSFPTRFIVGVLTLDSKLCHLISKYFKITLPGLSICIVGKKKSS
jgi:2-polyprenyl-3-methyl-5-hydroxy-6-metoxy-1,4-benzoquinol methylase